MARWLTSSTQPWNERDGAAAHELLKLLECGIPAHGLVRVSCGGCGHERLVVFFGTGDPLEPHAWLELLYLSIRVLSGVGLSDIVPQCAFARSLVMLEMSAASRT